MYVSMIVIIFGEGEMKFTNKQMVEEAMARIEQLQAHISAIEAAGRCLNERNPHQSFKIDYGNLRDILIQNELDEWRNLFMWAITLDDEERDRIKAAGYHRFLRDGMHVAHWINNGVSARSWLQSDDEQFRVMARKVFIPKTA